jgi:hypothetical protein
MAKLKTSLSNDTGRIKVAALTLHPILEPLLSVLIAENPPLLNAEVAKRASSYALSSQVFFSIKSESGEQFVTGPLIAWLPIARGLAKVDAILCIKDPNPAPSNIVARGVAEALLLLAAWPKSKTLEVDAAHMIDGLPDHVRRAAFDLQTRSTIEMAAALGTTRFKLEPGRGRKKDVATTPLGFDLLDLINDAGGQANVT